MGIGWLLRDWDQRDKTGEKETDGSVVESREPRNGEQRDESGRTLLGTPRALYISTALQRSTLYILYTLPQCETRAALTWSRLAPSLGLANLVAGRKAWTRPCAGSCEVSMDALLTG